MISWFDGGECNSPFFIAFILFWDPTCYEFPHIYITFEKSGIYDYEKAS